MPALAHQHQWTHTVGGLQCILPGCTAFMTGATIQANVNNSATSGAKHIDHQDIYNVAYKKSGLP